MDNEKFFKEAADMQSRMIKQSWKPLLVGAVLSLVGLVVAFGSLALIVKWLFFS